MLPQSRLPPPIRLERDRLPVLALVELQRGDETCLRDMAPADALTALISDNVRVTRSGLWPVQQGRLDLLVSMVGKNVLSHADGRPGHRGARGGHLGDDIGILIGRQNLDRR